LKTVLRALLAIAMLSGQTVTTGLAIAKSRVDPPIYLSATQRIATIERNAVSNAAQREIETSIDLGRIAPNAGGGGLLGAIIISASDDRREQMAASQRAMAEANAAPIRAQVRMIDVEAMARVTTQAALTSVPWFNLRQTTAQAAPASAAQTATVEYSYSLSPDFAHIRILATIALRQTLAAQATPPLFRMRLLSIVQLRNPSYEPRENAARWAAGDGTLVGIAFKSGFAKIGELIPYALSLDEGQARAIVAKGREKAFAAGLYGELISRGPNPGDVLIWADGPVSVQTLP
jgi:hypothetical protein